LDRLRDYIGFAVWFAGLGYIVIWPLAASGEAGLPFGASLLCAGAASGVLDFICHSPRPLLLPLPLHALGALSAIAVMVQVLAGGLSRLWRRHAGAPRPAPAPDTTARPLPPTVLRRLPRAKPRREFGLRRARNDNRESV
jgi:hypothetical protein